MFQNSAKGEILWNVDIKGGLTNSSNPQRQLQKMFLKFLFVRIKKVTSCLPTQNCRPETRVTG